MVVEAAISDSSLFMVVNHAGSRVVASLALLFMIMHDVSMYNIVA